MAYTAPDASDLKARYPAFAAVDDATVDVWLADAAQDCVAFPEDYRARAEMAYAAHRLSEIGYGADRGFAAGVVNNAAPADPGARTAATLAWECTGGIGAVRFSWSLAGAMFDAGSFSLSGR